MAKSKEEVFDSPLLTENVEFLDFNSRFDVSSDCASLKLVTELFAEEEKRNRGNGYSKQKRGIPSSQNKTLVADASLCYGSQITVAAINNVQSTELRAWGLPDSILKKYESRGITEMFEWQVRCLGTSKVLLECCNLVYSAPTSAGKTLVAEILTIKTLLERQKKVIIILPFVSIVREKTIYLQDILSSSGIRVEGFMGSQSPPGGLQAVHVAICTIEKANSLINKLLDDGTISELGAVIVDEMHLLGDPHRGYILELLLTKVKYVSSKCNDVKIQIVGMSATLPNLEVLAKWLDAELFVTSFRPIPLEEYCLIGNKYFNKEGVCAKTEDTKLNNILGSDSVLKICFSTIKEGCSTLIFCMTKNRCENLAKNIASSFHKLGCSKNDLGCVLREQLKTDAILEVFEQLKSCPVGLDEVLKYTISFGVAYHHAGLTFDERDIIEGSFKTGAIRVLVATSTLSSGVNLPARKVIVRTPVFLRQPINILTYKQMVGRAGRMGKDSKGESILICTDTEKKIGMDLMMGTLEPVTSCIEDDDKFMRAILEMIASEVACTNEELELYAKCTLLFTQKEVPETLLNTTLLKLLQFELIRCQEVDNVKRFFATSLGKACLSSSMAPNDGLTLFFELQKARECIVLETDLHLIYLVTPYSVSSQWADLDWLHLLTMYQSLSNAMKRVSNLIGIEEGFIIRRMKSANPSNAQTVAKKIIIHKRFYTALALQDLVNEVPLTEVATKFRCARGFLQSLQQAAATFAGMVTVFCQKLGWKNMELLIAQFQDRLHFGIQSELIELMKLPSLNGLRARSLFNAGLETIANVAAADCNDVENALLKALPFESEKQRDSDDDAEVRKRNKLKNVWITGHCGMTTKEAAENLILEARRYLQLELGVDDIKWDQKDITRHGQEFRNEIKAFTNKVNYESEKLTTSKEFPESKMPGASPNECFTMFALEAKVTTKVLHTKYEKGYVSNTDNKEFRLDLFNDKNTKSESQQNNNLSKETITKKLNENKTTAESLDQQLFDKTKIRDENVDFLKGEINESLKNEILWDSLNFTEVALSNLTKNRVSDPIFSPQISFSENEIIVNDNEKTLSSSKTVDSTKDVSLFSTDGADGSLFEDSLPIDQIPSNIIDGADVKYKINCTENTAKLSVLDTDSLALEFQSDIVIDDEEDIKLVYDDEENKFGDILFETEHNSTSNRQEKTKELKEIVESTPVVSSPHKHRLSIENEKNQPLRKKRKIPHKNQVVSQSATLMKPDVVSGKGSVTWDKKQLTYMVMTQNDVVLLDSIKTAALSFQIIKKTNQKQVIGSNILPKGACLQADATDVYTMAFYCGMDYILFFNTTGKQFTNSKMYTVLSQWLSRKDTTLRVASSKDTLFTLKNHYCLELNSCFDILSAQWFINSDERDHTLGALAKKHISKEIHDWNSIVKCLAVWDVAEKQHELLLTIPNSKITLDMDNQVSIILARSEDQGITVDRSKASELINVLQKVQDNIARKLQATFGYKVNINSSKDVAKILGIDKPRRVSTKKSVLMGLGPTAQLVILWRKIDTVLTKILLPLTMKTVLSRLESKIKPSYTMFTATGRMCMHEPNLQSVPRTFTIPADIVSKKNYGPLEINCRSIFKASPGYLLVSADYCQLEMRILTHYCKDVVLTEIMRSPEADVFKSIAASWCNIPEKDVDDNLRQKAKQLCYGIIYGMGNRALSTALDITEAEANVLMCSFDGTYPAITRFKNHLITKCSASGYVETLMKRRRHLPDIRLKNLAKRAHAERQAVNTTIQGSAADIAKAAMCAIDTNLRELPEEERALLILQMHDELIYEVPEGAKDAFIRLLKRAMENTVQLNVPLPVKVKIGSTWGSMKEFT